MRFLTSEWKTLRSTSVAVAADRRIARDRHAWHLAERGLQILRVQCAELRPRERDRLDAILRHALRLRDRRRDDDDGRQLRDDVRRLSRRGRIRREKEQNQ